MSIGRKLGIGFGIMLALMLLLSAGALIVTHDLNQELMLAANVTARQQYLAGEVNAATSEMANTERASVLAAMLSDGAHAPAYQQRFAERADLLRKALKDLDGIAGGDDTASLIRTLDRQATAVLEGHEELRQAIAHQQLDAALVIFAQKVQPQLEEIGRGASSLVDHQNKTLAASSSDAAAKAFRSTAYTIALAVLALAVGGVVFWVVRQANTALKILSGRMADNAAHVAGAASQVSGASQSLAQGASQQAASLEETSSSTEEIASITHKNAAHAAEVADLMQQTERCSGEANQTLDRMVEKMKEIDASSTKIAHIIKVIDEIAFQTNILALNAAVEAARAGEAGLGFAVVADEVRNLAQRCAQAARDTAALIEESIATSRDGNARLDQMAGAVRSMTENSLRVKSLVDEVHLGSKEQSRGMDQITRAVLQMQQVTQKTAGSAEESASAGAELNSNAATLRALVQEMRVMVGQ
jgi:methyl-accepting chemotaxis protein